MKRPTKPQRESIVEIMHYHKGAVASGDWTRGRGNYINKRVIPPLFKEVYVDSREFNELKGFARRASTRLLKRRPRVQRMIVPDNIRAVNKIVKEHKAYEKD